MYTEDDLRRAVASGAISAEAADGPRGFGNFIWTAP